MSGEKGDAKPGAGWPAVTLSLDRNRPGDTSVRAAMWPTFKLDTDERWFDELYVWTEGFQPGTMQRARIQLNALEKAFVLLEREKVRRVGVTLSFGTVERCLDLVTDAFDAHRFHAHRIVVLLRGQLDRLRSPYRVKGCIDWLRSQQIPVGYRLSAPRVSMEMRAIDLVQPDFAKLLAPTSKRPELWEDVLLEARAAGLRAERLIVAGIETREQRALAVHAGFGFAQGSAIRPAYDPPSIRTPATLPPGGGRDATADDTRS
ncbi:MAG: hypothetical protein ACK4V1_04950 [Burkholderiaceae bacterium]